MRLTTPRVVIVGSLLTIGAIFIILAVAFSGGGNSGLPDGWKSFSAGPFKGGIDRDWIVTYVDFGDYDPADLPDGIPDGIAEKLSNLKTTGEVKGILLIFFERDATFATSVNILSCEPAASVDLIDTTEDVINLYGRNFVNAEAIDKVTYDGAEFDLLQLFQVPQFDSYQVYLKTDDCYTAASLTTRTGDKAQIESFREFLGRLTIDASKLR